MRGGVLLLVGMITGASPSAHAQSGAATKRSPAATPSPLPSLPVIAAVHIDVAREHVVVTQDIVMARGDWRSGDLVLYVAFGAPGAPRAFDAHLYAAEIGSLEPRLPAAFEPVATERAPRRPPTANLLLGRPQMAGAVLHVREPAFRRATSAGGSALVRLRTLLDLPQENANATREVVVRLGTEAGPALALGPIDMRASDARVAIASAEARLCGDSADPYPIAITVLPKPSSPARGSLPARPAPIAPWLAVRHPTDDLCVRWSLAAETTR